MIEVWWFDKKCMGDEVQRVTEQNQSSLIPLTLSSLHLCFCHFSSMNASTFTSVKC